MFSIRYLASLSYDAMILLILFFAVTACILLCHHGQAIPPSTPVYQLALMGVAFTYYYCSIKFGGQTIGMRAWRFKLIDLAGSNISSQQIGLRILYFIPAVIMTFFKRKAPYTLLNQWTHTGFFNV